ncbi:deoxyribose-phosphate aldolase [Elusimicrobium simillimum]|uniref:deoxyribose-phosphate aldolase n=1 Tax=Elusimicrobium simillimum TaxID=3143438 RepID=UPI003C6EA66A
MNIAKLIDHTLLRPGATKEEIAQLCAEAKKFDFASVCVNPYWVKFCAEELKGTDVKVCTVIGFPLGANTTDVKVFEAANAVKNGAQEVDMVINIGALKSGLNEDVYHDIKLIRDLGNNFVLKVILETTLLTNEEKIKACELASCAGADFVKTSTGFANGGATVEDVKLMAANIKEGMQVKASGGVRDLETLKKMVEAGATRIGTSSGVTIMESL